MSSEKIKEILKDADFFGYIRAGADTNVYDQCAELILSNIFKDISIDQLQQIVWGSFCKVFYEPFSPTLDKAQAKHILGEPERFKGIALNIRYIVFGL